MEIIRTALTSPRDRREAVAVARVRPEVAAVVAVQREVAAVVIAVLDLAASADVTRRRDTVLQQLIGSMEEDSGCVFLITLFGSHREQINNE